MNLDLIKVPTRLGLMPSGSGEPSGTDKAPAVLGSLGLDSRLPWSQVHEVRVPDYDVAGTRTRFGIRNFAALQEQSRAVAKAVEDAVRGGRFPVILGGDCSVLIGSMLGLRRIGEAGLLFVDGHTDFFLPEQSGTGGAAGMDLALVTGWGPAGLTDLEDSTPLVDARRVAALGNRDRQARPAADIPSIEAAVRLYCPLKHLREVGVKKATTAAIDAVSGSGMGYWIHVDVDVIDSDLMPAVDSPQPDGLDWEELEQLLECALAGDAIGLQITIYDPDRDPRREAGRTLVDVLVAALETKGRSSISSPG